VRRSRASPTIAARRIPRSGSARPVLARTRSPAAAGREDLQLAGRKWIAWQSHGDTGTVIRRPNPHAPPAPTRALHISERGQAMLKTALVTFTLLFTPRPGALAAEDPEPERASQGRCDNAVNDGADVWQLMCGALVAPPETKQQCHAEHNEGRAKAVAACRFATCETACRALDERWDLYCSERIPRKHRKVCDRARTFGNGRCLAICRGRTLDDTEDDGTIGACSSPSQSESSR
jgi:hypothetical protein